MPRPIDRPFRIERVVLLTLKAQEALCLARILGRIGRPRKRTGNLLWATARRRLGGGTRRRRPRTISAFSKMELARLQTWVKIPICQKLGGQNRHISACIRLSNKQRWKFLTSSKWFSENFKKLKLPSILNPNWKCKMPIPTNGAKSSSSYLIEKRFWISTLKNQAIFSQKKASSPNLSRLLRNNLEQKSWTKVNISGCFLLFTTNPKSKMILITEKKLEDKLWTISSKRSFLTKITKSSNFWRLGWITCFIFQIWQLRPILKILNRQSSKTSRRFNKKKKSFSLMILTTVRLSKGSNKISLLMPKR